MWIDADDGLMARSDGVDVDRMLPHGRIGCAALIAVQISHPLFVFSPSFYPSDAECGRLSWVNEKWINLLMPTTLSSEAGG